MGKDEFVAEVCTFQGDSGFMVKQIHNGIVVSDQFLRDDEFDEYCELIGVKPVIVN